MDGVFDILMDSTSDASTCGEFGYIPALKYSIVNV